MLKITVITVCYNEKQKIRETIESVCRQTYPDMEYLIIDGASTDGTFDIIQEYKDYENIRIFSERDFGIYNAMNRGTARARGDYIFFLNVGDTFYNDHVLEDVCLYLKEDKEAIHYGKVCLVFPDGSKSIEDFSQWEGSLEGKVLDGFMPCHQSIFAPRRLLADHYFRETYKIRADYEWLVYSLSKGSLCKSMPVVISYYDTSGVSGKYRNRGLSLWEEEQILQEDEKRFECCTSLSEQRRDALKWKNLSQKHLFMFQLMNQWMALKQKQRCIGKYLRERNYNHIAIYGMGYIGQRLYDELEKEVDVRYAIDQKGNDTYADLKIYLPGDNLETVDAVIVTAIMCFDEIKTSLCKKVKCPIVALEDIIYEMTTEEKG